MGRCWWLVSEYTNVQPEERTLGASGAKPEELLRELQVWVAAKARARRSELSPMRKVSRPARMCAFKKGSTGSRE